MTHDFIIYGNGLSSKLLALALSKNNFKSLIIDDQKLKTKESNLVTFLSEGSQYISKFLKQRSFSWKWAYWKVILWTLISKRKKIRIWKS